MEIERFCSFCNRNPEHNRFLIVPHKRSTCGICEKCVVECLEIIVAGSAAPKQTTGYGLEFLDKIVARIRVAYPLLVQIGEGVELSEEVRAALREIDEKHPLFVEHASESL